MSKLAKVLKEAAMRNEELYLKLCKVDSVNETERTINCTPVDDSAKLISVDLQAMQEKKLGLLTVPKIDSEIIVGYLDKNNAVVLLYTEIDKIVLDVDNTIVINGGQNYGLVKIAELHNRLNAFEKAFNSHTHSHALSAPNGAVTGNIDAITNKSSEFQSNYSGYENEKIKH
jgi:hypothetical protein